MGSYSFSDIKWHHLHKLFVKFFFVFVILNSCFSVFAVDSDKSVLLEFKNSVSDPSGLLSSWSLMNPDHCTWFGIACDASSRVLSLNVTGGRSGGNSKTYLCSNLAQYPFYGFGIRRNCGSRNGKLGGGFSPVISKLSELTVLALPYNELSGEIPGEILRMEKLEVLDLEGNLITGSVSGWVLGLMKLRVLNLGFNRMTGDIPGWISNCEYMEELNLAGNLFNGTIPGFIGDLKRLMGIYLSFNQLGGSIPTEIGNNCGNLQHLDLSGNFLIGKIPNSLANCKQLRTLLLFANMLEDAIPPELGGLQRLEVLDVSRNSLSGPVPHQLGNCSELSVLVLSNLFDLLPITNETDGDTLSDKSANLSRDEYNYLEGTIPVEITMLPKLRMLWAPRATLEGSFPNNWGTCDSLEMINLAQNFFNGKIPDAFVQCKNLYFLDLNTNRLTGELGETLPVPCMTVFDVSENQLSGSIPKFSNTTCPQVPSLNSYMFEINSPASAYLSLFAFKSLTETPLPLFGEDDKLTVFHNFGGNNFTGSLQSMPIASNRLGKRTVYAFLADNNKLTGPFPGILFEKCDELNALYVNVSNNNMPGQIPVGINTMCRSLKLLDASSNQLNGVLPPTIGQLVSLVALNLSWNLMQGQIPASIGQIKVLRYLSLAGSNLTGLIPSSLGQLLALETLELSSNSLSGQIPKDLSNLCNLTVLLLNNNKLSGQIPSGLANVMTLSTFNVSFNNLSGPLPHNDNLMKCSSVLGNPFIKSCRMFSLTVPSSDSQGSTEDYSQNYSATTSETTTQLSGSKSFNSIEIASITSASAIVAVLLALVLLYFYTRRWDPKFKSLGSMRKEVIVFTDIGVSLNFESVVRATGSFNANNCIGNGGFGATYKAEMSPNVLVAIKRLYIGRFQGVQQFDAEIRTLGRLHHPNLVTLIGYHASESEMFLIYNYLPGGNLEKFIQERSTRAVDWRILHKIALDIARALAYLHDQCVPRVLHRDVKPSNILLDDDFNAYLSDFGLARLLGTSETHATTGVAGTFGYVAPEYAMTCRVSDKADVYSYGVVLLELLSDKKALDPSFSPYGNGFNIVAWACMLLPQGRAKEFFAAGLWNSGPHDDLVEVLHLAVVCTVESLSTRPTMRQVARRLKKLQPPSC